MDKGPRALNILPWGEGLFPAMQICPGPDTNSDPLTKLVVAKAVAGVLSDEPIGSLEAKDNFSRRPKGLGQGLF